MFSRYINSSRTESGNGISLRDVRSVNGDALLSLGTQGNLTLDTLGVQELIEALEEWKAIPRCPYTHSHTRHWCGYDTCRES